MLGGVEVEGRKEKVLDQDINHRGSRLAHLAT